jgi:hypothetical protein
MNLETLAEIKMKPIKQISLFFVVLTVTLLFISSMCFGATYYVDATNGNDSNPGISLFAPWKTISKVNNSSFNPGDFILFKRDEIWRERLKIPSSGFNGNPIIFGAYSSGDKPVINGSDLVKTWEVFSPGDNIWSATLTVAAVPTQVFFDDTKGTKESSIENLDAANEWYWESNVLYVYSTSDPDSAYTDPGIEWSRTTTDNGVYATGKNYITIQDLAVTKCALVGIYGAGSSSNWTIDNVDISYNMKHGIQFSGSNGDDQTGLTVQNSVISYCEASGINGGSYNHDWILQNNEISYCSTGDTYNYQGAIYIGAEGCEGILVQENYIHDNGDIAETSLIQGCGIWFDGDSDGGEDSYQDGNNPSIIRYNLLDGNKFGIKIENTSYVEVYNNIVFNCMNDDTNWHFGVGYFVARECHHNKIYNNVGYNNRINLRISGDFPIEDDNITNNKVKNNIFENAITREFEAKFWDLDNNMTGLGNQITYNCFGAEASNFIEWGNEVYKSTYDNWEIAYGGTSHSIESAPLLADPDRSNFALKSQSPCIDKGIEVGLTHDFVGTSLPQGKIVDIGAYEFVCTISAPNNFSILLK